MTTRKADKSMISDRLFAVIALLAVCPLFFAFAMAGQPARGRAAAIAAGMIIVVARFTWEQRNRAWYWMAVSCFVGVHAIVVLLASWQEKSYPGFALLPIAAADFAAMYAAIKLIEALLNSRSGHSRKRDTFDNGGQC